MPSIARAGAIQASRRKRCRAALRSTPMGSCEGGTQLGERERKLPEGVDGVDDHLRPAGLGQGGEVAHGLGESRLEGRNRQ